MKNKYSLIFLMLILITSLFCSCRNDPNMRFGEDIKKIAAYVLQRTDDGFYLVPEDTSDAKKSGEIYYASFSKLKSEYKDIQKGDFIELLYDGFVVDMYPAEFHAVYQMNKIDEDYDRVSRESIENGQDYLTELFVRDGYLIGENGMNRFLDNVLEKKASSCVFYRYTAEREPVYYYIDYKVESILGPRFHLTVDYSKIASEVLQNENHDFDYLLLLDNEIAAFGECLNNNIKNCFTLLDDDEHFNLIYTGLFTPTEEQQEKIVKIIENYSAEERKGIVRYNPSGNAKIELEPEDENFTCIFKTENNIYDESLYFSENRDLRYTDLNCFVGACWYNDDLCFLYGENDYSSEYPYTVFAFLTENGIPKLKYVYMDYSLPREDVSQNIIDAVLNAE